MAQELHTASKLLSVAIDRYLYASSAFRDSCIHEIALRGVPVELADTANNEIQRALAFESKLKQSIAAISLVRNTAPTTVPINSLPSEILTRIFQLVLDPSPPPIYTPMKLLPQDVLSHVCTYWRRVATESRPFWSRIDLGLLTAHVDRHLARAKTYAARANPSPLDVQISVTDLAPHSEASASSQARLAEFIGSVSPRIQSLQFHANGPLMGLYRLLMESCLATATPGTLRALIISVREVSSNGRHHFIDTVGSSEPDQCLLLNVDQERLEAVLLPIRVLWVSGLYPYWASKAYHGLTELRIDADGWVSITESQLVDVLVASPKLRTLIFCCEITDPRSQPDLILPVRLAELESLSIHITGGGEERESAIETLLRLLAPGPNPLSLTITGGRNWDRYILGGSVRQFLSRAHVTKMSLSGSGGYSVTAETLCVLPRLQELMLDGLALTCNDTLGGPSVKFRSVSSPGQVSLSLVSCAVELGTLRRIIESTKIYSLSVWNCFPPNIDHTEYLSEDAIRVTLSDLCSVTRAAGPRDYQVERMEWEKWPQVD